MVIYYFSGTGNCYFVSKMIAKEIGENVKIVPIGHAYRNGLFETASDSIGFVYPAYAYGLPKVVRQFVKKLKAPNVKYAFGIVTYGTRPGSVHGGMNRLLKKKKIKLNYAGRIKSVENFTPIFKIADEDKVKKLIENTKNEAIKIAGDIQNEVNNKFKKHFVMTALISSLFIVIATWLLPKLFKVRGCDDCGLCKKVCPMSNIDMVKGKPKFRKYCNVCMACINVCPKKAIRLFRATKKSRRYFNPEVSLSEFTRSDT